MRRGLGIVLRVLLVLLGAVLLLAGGAASVLVGPDDTAQTGPHRMGTRGVAILTAAEALHYVGPTLHLRVQSADGDPVFVGIANEVDAESYVGESTHLVVERVKLPWTPATEVRGTTDDALPAPVEQPWWLHSATGSGPQDLVWPIPHGRYAIVVANADGSPAVEVDVTLGLELRGTFYAVLAVAVFGLALLLVGVWLWLRARRRARTARQVVVVEPDGTDAVSTGPSPTAGPQPAPPVSRDELER